MDEEENQNPNKFLKKPSINYKQDYTKESCERLEESDDFSFEEARYVIHTQMKNI